MLKDNVQVQETRGETKGKIAWDCNEKSPDGFSPNMGWIRINLRKLFHIHRVYEIKRKRLKQKASKKPLLRRPAKRMLNGSREHKRHVSKGNWKAIIFFMSYKSEVVLLNPQNSTRRCSRWRGFLRAQSFLRG